ncbi:MAG: hypothetical protein BroJett038_13470 [Chloroflexota bacterium]|nr:MAG: hypothetical protein BroJett038_13470 [Chloroflexota bacterium]
MRDVVIIGGGLSGLAAAHELERLNITYTLIEVKARLGGSIISRRQNGFVLDGGACVFPAGNWSFLDDLGLREAQFTFQDGRLAAFQNGTQSLVDALARPLRGEILLRMAVSSLGVDGAFFGVCLENGLLLNTRALIVAVPARYAEHMFRALQPEVSLRLLDYDYDTITRVSLGCRREQIGAPGRRLWDMGLPFYYEIEHSCRAPAGCVLVHAGVRFALPQTTPQAVIAALQTQLDWPDNPLVSWVTYWPEADPLPPHTPGFRDRMAALRRLLPERVALVGSDYDGLGLNERVAAGRSAARQIAAGLAAR